MSRKDAFDIAGIADVKLDDVEIGVERFQRMTMRVSSRVKMPAVVTIQKRMAARGWMLIRSGTDLLTGRHEVVAIRVKEGKDENQD